MSRSNFFVGIDPDSHGAIAIVGRRDVPEIIDMPVLPMPIAGKRRRRIDTAALREIMADISSATLVALEEPYPSRFAARLAIATSFTQYAWFLGALDLLRIPYRTVTPRVWQTEFFGHRTATRSHDADTKSLSYQIAVRLYPECCLTNAAKKPIHGRSDALLIATYAMHVGDKPVK